MHRIFSRPPRKWTVPRNKFFSIKLAENVALLGVYLSRSGILSWEIVRERICLEQYFNDIKWGIYHEQESKLKIFNPWRNVPRKDSNFLRIEQFLFKITFFLLLFFSFFFFFLYNFTDIQDDDSCCLSLYKHVHLYIYYPNRIMIRLK